jgi:hypothetical protein
MFLLLKLLQFLTIKENITFISPGKNTLDHFAFYVYNNLYKMLIINLIIQYLGTRNF